MFLLQVEAFDADEPGTANSDIRYEIINGNYEKKFYIEPSTGVISVQEPLDPATFGRTGRDTKLQQVGSGSGDSIEPVISLTVRAYDLGIPSQGSEVLVHIFTERVATRTMRFIVNEEPAVVDKKQDEIR